VTFTCYRREPLPVTAEAKRLVERALEQARRQYVFWVWQARNDDFNGYTRKKRLEKLR
jgi:hypothetical protein